jgi:hypothetical protein
MSAQPFSLVVAVLFSSMVVVRGHAAEEAPHLTTEDRKYLDGLMREFVFDPIQGKAHIWAGTSPS